VGSFTVIEDGSVLIKNGKIELVGATRRVENLAAARQATEIDASGKVVMPAFVDAHNNLMRDCTGRATGRVLGAQADRVIRLCVRHGTGTLEARSGCGIEEAADLKMLRAAGHIDAELATAVPVYAGPGGSSAAQQLDWIHSSLLPRIHSRNLARHACAVCGPGGLSAEDTKRYIDMCRRHGLRIKIETGGTSETDCVGLAIASDAIAVEALNRATEADAAALAESSSIATLLPGLTFAGIRDRFPPARMLIDSGSAVALASGFRYGEASTFSMQAVIAMACAQMGMTVGEAIAATTINGAHALGVGDRVGSLQYGKDADVLVLNISDYRDLARNFGGNLVQLTIKKGRTVYRESEVQ